MGVDETGYWKVKLTAPAVEGKANQALVRFIARLTGLPISSVSIFRGEHSRMKCLQVSGVTQEQLDQLIAGSVITPVKPANARK
jgi:uncharacterized protein (TIGR00251 family)